MSEEAKGFDVDGFIDNVQAMCAMWDAREPLELIGRECLTCIRHMESTAEAAAKAGLKGEVLAVLCSLVKLGHAIDAKAEAIDAPKGGALAKLAGIWCNTAEFRDFLNSTFGIEPVDDDRGARQFLLNLCAIKSRAELDHNPEAAAIFHREIRAPYAKWRIGRGLA